MGKLEKIEGIKKGVKLEKFSTFGMGGEADFYFEALNNQDLINVYQIASLENMPVVLAGWGSNMIFSEKGLRGIFIRNLSRKVLMDGPLVTAEGGTLLSQIIQVALKNSLIGMEKMMGLPGTIGGAVRGNAGAFGVEIKDLVEKVEIWSLESGYEILTNLEMEFGYRESKIKRKGGIVTRVWLKLEKGDTQKAVEEIRQITISRLGKQPAGKTCGSFFKNPSANSVGIGLAAGAALEQVGMRGYRFGDVMFSEKHANWLMNCGMASLDEVIGICRMAQDKVREKFGIDLEREVQLVGEYGFIPI